MATPFSNDWLLIGTPHTARNQNILAKRDDLPPGSATKQSFRIPGALRLRAGQGHRAGRRNGPNQLPLVSLKGAKGVVKINPNGRVGVLEEGGLAFKTPQKRT